MSGQGKRPLAGRLVRLLLPVGLITLDGGSYVRAIMRVVRP